MENSASTLDKLLPVKESYPVMAKPNRMGSLEFTNRRVSKVLVSALKEKLGPQRLQMNNTQDITMVIGLLGVYVK